jgi:hypothetical protein
MLVPLLALLPLAATAAKLDLAVRVPPVSGLWWYPSADEWTAGCAERRTAFPQKHPNAPMPEPYHPPLVALYTWANSVQLLADVHAEPDPSIDPFVISLDTVGAQYNSFLHNMTVVLSYFAHTQVYVNMHPAYKGRGEFTSRGANILTELESDA